VSRGGVKVDDLPWYTLVYYEVVKTPIRGQADSRTSGNCVSTRSLTGSIGHRDGEGRNSAAVGNISKESYSKEPKTAQGQGQNQKVFL